MNPPKPEIVTLLNRAMASLARGDLLPAERAIADARARDPQSPHAALAFAMLCYQQQQLDSAHSTLTALTKQEPTFPPAWSTLGLVLRAQGHAAASVVALERAHALSPHYVEAAFNLALSYQDLNRSADAMRLYRHVLALQPSFAPAKTNLGVLARKVGDFATAREVLAPLAHEADADAKLNYALLLTDMGDYANALRFAREATRLAPNDVAAWEALGQAALLGGDAEIAAEAFAHANTLAPGDAERLYDLGRAEIACGEMEKGKVTLSEALRINADFIPALFARELALPPLYQSAAHMAEARAAWSAGIARVEERLITRNDWPVAEALKAVSTYVPYALHYLDTDNTALQIRFGKIVENVVGRAFPAFSQPCDWRPMSHGGRIRVGFVSAYLRNHSVGNFFSAWITDLVNTRFETFVWSLSESEDALTARVASCAAHFSRQQAIKSVASEIRAAQLDVLIHIDVGMHPHAQVLAAMRLAPIQCTGYGHPITTGLATVSHFLSADAAEPENAAAHYVEKLIRLPNMGVKVRAAALPATLPENAPLQFLCAQRLFKVLPHMDTLIARILRRVPGGHVSFIASLSSRLNAQFVARISTELNRHGLDPAKTLTMLPVMPHAQFLQAMNAATLLLDTIHFSGGNTSFDAFALGAPVLAYEGAMLRGRQTSAMLRILGIGELIAKNDDQYVEIACALATNATLRAELRNRILANNHKLFGDNAPIRALEAALQDLVTCISSTHTD